MNNRKHIRLMVAARAVVLMFVLYYANISLFEHCHIVNGVTIVHSHFHGTDHGNGRGDSHTSNELTLMALNNHFVSSGWEAEVFDFSPLRLLVATVGSAPAPKPVSSSLPYVSLRAPPCWMLIS